MCWDPPFPFSIHLGVTFLLERELVRAGRHGHDAGLAWQDAVLARCKACMAGRSAGKMQGLHGSTGKMQTDKRKVLAGSGGGDDFVTMSFSYIYMYLCRDNPQWGGLAEGRRAGINFDAEAVPQASAVQGAAVDSVLAQLENAGAVGAGEGSHGTKEPCATMALVTGPGLPALSKKIVERIRSLISRSCPQQKAGAVQSLMQALEGQVINNKEFNPTCSCTDHNHNETVTNQ